MRRALVVKAPAIHSYSNVEFVSDQPSDLFWFEPFGRVIFVSDEAHAAQCPDDVGTHCRFRFSSSHGAMKMSNVTWN